MKQVYYTQCPIGYGLGASNGFQVKRLSPDFAVTGDFRHFSLRAFVAGTRIMAPAVLRYRRGEGGAAEVAWLTPRSHEYETERGPWGRPGGHFAHGLRLDDDELRALCDWPAGLFDRPFWARGDREPSRGLPPPALALSTADLARPPTFAAVAPLAEGEDVEGLAALLTALAAAAREGRTLFLIDDPARLAERVALLTFAFPEPWRGALTFSTYHDRPEELPGFRLQGTIAAARPNRHAMMAQGFVADLASGTIEPRIESAGWARTLAGWLVRRLPDDRDEWEATRRRALRARPAAGPDSPWSEERLTRLFGLPAMVRVPPRVPGSAREWSELSEWTTWAGTTGLADTWVRSRPPAWWSTAAIGAAGAEARAALVRHLGLPESWRGEQGQATAWGEVVAPGVRSCTDLERLETASAALDVVPVAARSSFAGALLRGLPAETADAIVRRLESEAAWDRSILLPMKARGAIVAAITARDPGALVELLARAMALPAATTAVLDGLAREAEDLPGSVAIVARHVAEALTKADAVAVAATQRWALSRGEAARAWLGPFWTRLFADPLDVDIWRGAIEHMTPELRAALTPVVLGVAIDPGRPVEAFLWGIDDLVLARPESERPHERAWPGAYLDRLPSGLDLLRRLFAPEYRPLGARRWLRQACDRGELLAAQSTRLDDCERYARALQSRDAQALLEIRLPDVPAEERGMLLGQILAHLGDGTEASLDLAIDSGRAAWPDGFAPGAPGLAGLARAIAGPLMAIAADPALWFERLRRVLDRLGLVGSRRHGDEPDGLAAEIVAATTRRPCDGFDPWRLRQFLLREDDAWRTLAADIRDDLRDQSIDASLTQLDHWDRKLDKGRYAARFFEAWLNACDPARLSAAVCHRAADLRHLDLPWWESARHPGAADDLRERFVRMAPMAPLRAGTLAMLRLWLLPPQPAAIRRDETDLAPLDPDEPLVAHGTADDSRGARVSISAHGLTRWRCLEALTIFSHPDETLESRRQRLRGWTKGLPLGLLDLQDRHRFLGWLIVGFPRLDPGQVEELARWLFECGIDDPECDWMDQWFDDLSSVGDVDGALRLERAALVSDLVRALRGRIRDETGRGRKTKTAGSR